MKVSLIVERKREAGRWGDDGGWRLVSTAEAARSLGLSSPTLEAWRLRGGVDLPFYKLGRLFVRYDTADLLAFVERAARAYATCGPTYGTTC